MAVQGTGKAPDNLRICDCGGCPQICNCDDWDAKWEARHNLSETEAIALNRQINASRPADTLVERLVSAPKPLRGDTPPDTSSVRTFDTGATRDTEDGKLDYEGFLSPLVLERYARYMDTHRAQKDGSLRSSDNWQRGIPRDAYVKSAWRHFMEFWGLHRGHGQGDIEDALCASLFNLSGYLHELLKSE